MRISKSTVTTFALMFTGLVLSACGDKAPATGSSAPASSAASAPATTDSKKEEVKSIAKNLADYKDIVLTKSITEDVWKKFLVDYGQLAASKEGITDKELLIAAYPDLASNPDPFKREEATTDKAAELKALRSAATPKIRLVVPSTANIGVYNMEKESYGVSLDSGGGEFSTPWSITSKDTAELTLKYCIKRLQGYRCADSWSAEVKVPKDQARTIEAELAKQGRRTLAIGLYASVKEFQYYDIFPAKNSIELSVEAVSLHVQDKQDRWNIDSKNTVLFIDGPDLYRAQ